MHRAHKRAKRERAVQTLAEQFYHLLGDWLTEAGKQIDSDLGGSEQLVQVGSNHATPEEDERSSDRLPKSKWWQYQVIETAKRADHCADLSSPSWWRQLWVSVQGYQMRFVVSIHHVSRSRDGVMAITTFADIRLRVEDEELRHEESFVETSLDAFYFSHDDQVGSRSDALYEWLDRSLAVGLHELMVRTLRG